MAGGPGLRMQPVLWHSDSRVLSSETLIPQGTSEATPTNNLSQLNILTYHLEVSMAQYQ